MRPPRFRRVCRQFAPGPSHLGTLREQDVDHGRPGGTLAVVPSALSRRRSSRRCRQSRPATADADWLDHAQCDLQPGACPEPLEEHWCSRQGMARPLSATIAEGSRPPHPSTHWTGVAATMGTRQILAARIGPSRRTGPTLSPRRPRTSSAVSGRYKQESCERSLIVYPRWTRSQATGEPPYVGVHVGQ